MVAAEARDLRYFVACFAGSKTYAICCSGGRKPTLLFCFYLLSSFRTFSSSVQCSSVMSLGVKMLMPSAPAAIDDCASRGR